MPCNETGFLPLNTPPPPRTKKISDDWSPYDDESQFKLADFLYTKCQMSAGNINELLEIWAARDESAPFMDHRDLYATIDSTDIATDSRWKSFSLEYEGEIPAEDVPSWMTVQQEVWYRDPRILVHGILANPDFKNDFDPCAYREYNFEGNHRYIDFMSGNWAWRQSVSGKFFISASAALETYHRI